MASFRNICLYDMSPQKGRISWEWSWRKVTAWSRRRAWSRTSPVSWSAKAENKQLPSKGTERRNRPLRESWSLKSRELSDSPELLVQLLPERDVEEWEEEEERPLVCRLEIRLFIQIRLKWLAGLTEMRQKIQNTKTLQNSCWIRTKVKISLVWTVHC